MIFTKQKKTSNKKLKERKERKKGKDDFYTHKKIPTKVRKNKEKYNLRKEGQNLNKRERKKRRQAIT